jgi:hypothetical protein
MYTGAAHTTKAELARIDGALHARVRKYRVEATTERRAREAAEARAEAAAVRVSALAERAGTWGVRCAHAHAQARDAARCEQQARADAADLHARAGTLEMKIVLLVDRCAELARERDGARAGTGSEAASAEPVPPALVAEFRRAVAQDYARRCDIRLFVAYPGLTWLQSGEGARTRRRRTPHMLATLRQPTPAPAHAKAGTSPRRSPVQAAIDLTDGQAAFRIRAGSRGDALVRAGTLR